MITVREILRRIKLV